MDSIDPTTAFAFDVLGALLPTVLAFILRAVLEVEGHVSSTEFFVFSFILVLNTTFYFVSAVASPDYPEVKLTRRAPGLVFLFLLTALVLLAVLVAASTVVAADAVKSVNNVWLGLVFAGVSTAVTAGIRLRYLIRAKQPQTKQTVSNSKTT